MGKNTSAEPRWGGDSDIETLAAIARKTETPGIAFARSQLRLEAKTNKDEARARVCRAFSRREFPKSLSILTMPGTQWRFEKSILKTREPGRDRATVHRTYITALEREPPIYVAALRNIPGANFGLRHLPGDFKAATYSMRTPLISRFHLASFEDFAEANTMSYAGAWLDFTGPITARLMKTIPYFWTFVRELIVITSLDARWCRDVSNKVTRIGGVIPLLNDMLPGSEVVETYRYIDKVPMIQVSLRRKNP
jgi:hypothetical protein